MLKKSSRDSQRKSQEHAFLSVGCSGRSAHEYGWMFQTVWRKGKWKGQKEKERHSPTTVYVRFIAWLMFSKIKSNTLEEPTTTELTLDSVQPGKKEKPALSLSSCLMRYHTGGKIRNKSWVTLTTLGVESVDFFFFFEVLGCFEMAVGNLHVIKSAEPAARLSR